MTDKQADRSSGGWRRALYEWLVGPTPAPESNPSRADAPAAKKDEPTRIGHYAITRKLGEGGMGVVYAARDERLERTVAVKTMSSLADDETARKRFWREARAAASVNHPNVCQIHEIGEDGGTLFIAMELLEGESLADRLRGGPMRAAEAVPMALGMLAALSALHGRGLVHRDLKPSNVFLTPHGVKLLDFGLARPGPAGGPVSSRIDAKRHRHRHAALYGAGTGAGRAGRCPLGHLRRRRDPVRNAVGSARVHGRSRSSTSCMRRFTNIRPR